jgi:hypothetical protein
VLQAFETDFFTLQVVSVNSGVRLPNETSLQHFVRQNCDLSPHLSDFVLASDFNARYSSFCTSKNERPMSTSSENMKAYDNFVEFIVVINFFGFE